MKKYLSNYFGTLLQVNCIGTYNRFTILQICYIIGQN